MKPFERKPYTPTNKDGAPPAGEAPHYPFKSAPEKGSDTASRPAARPQARPQSRADGAKSAYPFKSAPLRKDARPSPKVDKKSQIPTASRRIALEALMDVESEGAFSTLTLDKRLRETKLSDEDRRLTTALFYGAIERKLTLDFALAQCMQRPPEDILTRVNLRMAALQILFMDIPDYAACGEAVAMTRYKGREALCPLVNAVVRELSRKKDTLAWPEDPVERLSVMASAPQWMVERLIAEWDFATAEAFLNYHPQERFSCVRTNLMLSNPQEVEKALTAQGMRCQSSQIPGVWRVTGGSPADTEEFRRGLFSVQGEASMLAVLALGVKGGMQVLDACAAPGGKACQIGEIMNGSGRVHAMDVRQHRVNLIEAQARRLKLENIRPRIGNATDPIPSMEGTLHAVLVDAPCSGLGVVHAKPDIKYNITQDALADLPVKQLAILEACARSVRPGGVLVYSTCTVLRAENQDVVAAFLKKHPEFVLAGLAERMPEAFAAKVQDGMLSLHPQEDGTDGFFIARMERKG